MSLIAVMAMPVEAGPVYGALSFDAVCDGAGPTQITVDVVIEQDFAGQVGQIRVWRSTVGDCAPPVEIGVAIVDPLAPGEFTFEFTDQEAIGGLPFKYWVTLHDAAGEDLRVSNYFSMGNFIDVVSSGTAMIGQGRLRSRDIPGEQAALRSDTTSPVLEPCSDSCWMALPISNAEDPLVQAHLDTDVPVLLIGDIWCGDIISGCYLVISEIYTSDCQGTVPAKRRSWGSLKSQF